jgi:hypothetical protein
MVQENWFYCTENDGSKRYVFVLSTGSQTDTTFEELGNSSVGMQNIK